ncbi:MAG: hypothetical protein HGA78_03095 [Nitrospirales bacterium]|nr:hypothetical protein [Nitrospirales bacterium]
MASEAKRVALINKKSIEGQLNSTMDPLIRQKIYDMIAKQIEKTVMSEAKENAAFKVIDPPIVPVEKYRPKRSLIVIGSFVASLFLGIFAALVKEFIDKKKSSLSKEDKRCS